MLCNSVKIESLEFLGNKYFHVSVIKCVTVLPTIPNYGKIITIFLNNTHVVQ